MSTRLRTVLLTGGVLVGAAAWAAPGAASVGAGSSNDPAATAATTTPIKHVVVIFQENISFDHYFGTYPVALNPAGEPPFTAAANTPAVNGLCGPLTEPPSSKTAPPCDSQAGLLAGNPNSSNPQRLDRSQPLTCDQDHNYTDEQTAFDHGIMDKFVETVGAGGTQNQGTLACDPRQVMDYYDGNTVTALWNYAQHFAINDNSYGTGFGPSTPGALNLMSGNTFGANCGNTGETNPAEANPCPAAQGPTAQGTATVFGDPQPAYDKCSTRDTTGMGGRNVGDLLNARLLTWGWFQGGFDDCTATHRAIGLAVGAASKVDYIPHHEPFQYYPSTANPLHLPPSSVSAIGHTDQANHQYDLSDFWAAVDARNLPAVSFLKAPGFEDGHAGYSTPLDEQRFLVDTINRLEKTDSWHTTAVVIAYDDSDGWYDHQLGPALFQSQTAFDSLSNPGQCGSNAAKVPSGQQTRCGYGPRLPLLVISPFARHNFVDNTLTDQSSILRFIEDNWSLGRIGSGSADAVAGPINNMFDFDTPQFERLFLDPVTGEKAG